MHALLVLLILVQVKKDEIYDIKSNDKSKKIKGSFKHLTAMNGEEGFIVLVLYIFLIVICVVILYIRKLEFLIRGFLSGDVINGSFMKM